MRPAGKPRHQFSPSPPLGAGSKTGLVMRRPFAFCCEVLRVLLFVVWSLRGVCCYAGSCCVPPHTPALCGRGCATTAYVVGGGFPLTPPNPLAGK